MHVLSVSSLKGGVGKTTVTLGLASAAFAKGVSTLVVDLDPQADVSTGMDIDLSGHLNVADVLAAPKARTVRSAIAQSGWTAGRSGKVDVLIGSPAAINFDGPHPSVREIWKLEEALAHVEDEYDLVLIDCAPSLNGLTRTAWAASDRVAVVTEPGLFSVAAADRALRAIEELRRGLSPRLQPLGIVVNRARVQSLEHQFRIKELRDMFGPLVLSPQLPERTSLQQAQGAAKPLHMWPGESAQEMAGHFDLLLERVMRAGHIQASSPAPEPPYTGQIPVMTSPVEELPLVPEPADAAPVVEVVPHVDPVVAETSPVWQQPQSGPVVTVSTYSVPIVTVPAAPEPVVYEPPVFTAPVEEAPAAPPPVAPAFQAPFTPEAPAAAPEPPAAQEPAEAPAPTVETFTPRGTPIGRHAAPLPSEPAPEPQPTLSPLFGQATAPAFVPPSFAPPAASDGPTPLVEPPAPDRVLPSFVPEHLRTGGIPTLDGTLLGTAASDFEQVLGAPAPEPAAEQTDEDSAFRRLFGRL